MTATATRRAIQGLASVLLLAGALLPPRLLVVEALPAAYRGYQTGYVEGLWLLKAALCGGGLLGWLLAQRLAAVFRGEGPGAPAVRLDRWDWLAVGALSLTALGLRVIGLNRGFTGDEAFLMQALIMREPVRMLLHPSGSAHTLNSLLAHGAVRLLGPSEWAARLPAVCCGAAAPALLYLVARRWLSRPAGLLAAVLLCVSPIHIWYSQEAKGNAALVCAVLLGWLMLARLNEGWRPRAAAIYALSLVAAGLAHLSGVLFVALQGAVFLWPSGLLRHADARRRVLALHGLALWALLVCTAPILPFLGRQGEAISRIQGTPGLGRLVADIARQWTFLDQPWPLVGLAVGLALAGGVFLWRRTPGLALLLLAPFAADLVVTTALKLFSSPRYHMAFLPAVIVLLAAGGWALWTVTVRRRALAIAVVCGVGAIGLAGEGRALGAYYRVPKSAAKAVAGYMAANPGTAFYVPARDRHGFPANGLLYYIDSFATDATIDGVLGELDPRAPVGVVALPAPALSTIYAPLVRRLASEPERPVRFACQGELDQYRVKETFIYRTTAGRLRAILQETTHGI